MDGAMLRAVRGWQLTTETWHTVRARIFIDCSGDGVLAPLTGAAYRMGREARREYGESIAPVRADSRTMGLTCFFQTRRYDTPQPFEPPAWARRFDRCDELPYGPEGHADWELGYWWVELGGEGDSLHDAEAVREELLPIALGVWDHVKNRCPRRAEAANWALDWVQFLPAKRESRRYVGAHVLTQNDIEAGGRFEDLVAYGGWDMDDHHPAGFRAVKLGAPATQFHPAPAPYGIPYRCLYSRDVPNLMFAGRDASCSHVAMSSTRVMGTGCIMGQAAGTAAALAVRRGLMPAGMLDRIDELQQALLRDDAWLPGIPRKLAPLTRDARLTASTGDPAPLLDGIHRPVGNDSHAWIWRPGDHVALRFAAPARVGEVSAVLDSALDQLVTMSLHPLARRLDRLPDVLPRAFRLEGLSNGRWRTLARVKNNRGRLWRMRVERELAGVRLVLEETWGAPSSRLFAFYAD